MHATLFLRLTTPGVIPWEYPQYLTAWIYRNMPPLSDHHTTHRRIRPFAVSRLQFADPVQADAAGLRPLTPFATLQMGAADAALLTTFARQAPRSPLRLGTAVYAVETILVEPVTVPLDSTSLTVHLTSPLVIAERSATHSRSRIFIGPDHARWALLLRQNLAKKSRRFFGGSGALDTVAVTIPDPARWRRKVNRLYGHAIVGWTAIDPITITGSADVCEAALTLGLGVYNAHGFGAVAAQTPHSMPGDDSDSYGRLSMMEGMA